MTLLASAAIASALALAPTVGAGAGRGALAAGPSSPAGGVSLYERAADGSRHAVAPRFAPDAADALLALVTGLLESEAYGSLAGQALDSLVTAHGPTRLPTGDIVELSRLPSEGPGQSIVRLRLRAKLRIEAPYTLLGHAPGALVTGPELVLEEHLYGDEVFVVPGGTTAMRVKLSGLRVYWIREGKAYADVDGWIDRLLGDRIDDVDIRGFALFRYRRHHYALAFGYNPRGEGRTGAFDLTTDSFPFPVPRPFLVAGRVLRSRLEALYQQHDEVRHDPGAEAQGYR